MKNNIINYIEINKINFIVYALCISVIIVFSLCPSNIISKKEGLSDGNYPAEIIKSDIVYSQTFKSNIDFMESIGIPFSTYGIENSSGSLNIKLLDINNNLIKEETVELKDLKDNSVYYLNFKPIKKSKNKKYIIEFKYDNYNKNNSLTYWFDYKKNTKKNGLMKNGEESNELLFFYIIGKRKDYFLVVYIIIILVINSIMLVIKEEDE